MKALQYIHVGQFFMADGPTVISTVLGSCVAVCLWDRQRKIGAMNHYLLPGEDGVPGMDMNRGFQSVDNLVHMMLTRKSTPWTMEAKVFGGANSLYIENDQFKVGERNIAAAFAVLEHYGINVVASHVGGSRGRKIFFDTETGKVRMTLLSANYATGI